MSIIPNNTRVLRFFTEYGLAVVLAICVFFFLRFSLIGIITRLEVLLGGGACSLDNLAEPGQISQYGGVDYKVKDMTLYENSGEIGIELKSINH